MLSGKVCSILWESKLSFCHRLVWKKHNKYWSEHLKRLTIIGIFRLNSTYITFPNLIGKWSLNLTKLMITSILCLMQSVEGISPLYSAPSVLLLSFNASFIHLFVLPYYFTFQIVQFLSSSLLFSFLAFLLFYLPFSFYELN